MPHFKNSFGFHLTIFVVCFLIMFYGTIAEKKELTKAEEKASLCRKFLMIMAKRMLKPLMACIKVEKEKHPGPEFNEYFQCAIKCFMVKVEIIDANYMVSNASMSVFVEKHMPERFHEVYYRISEPCLAEWASKVDPTDEKCIAYGEVYKCLQHMSTVCP